MFLIIVYPLISAVVPIHPPPRTSQGTEQRHGVRKVTLSPVLSWLPEPAGRVWGRGLRAIEGDVRARDVAWTAGTRQGGASREQRKQRHQKRQKYTRSTHQAGLEPGRRTDLSFGWRGGVGAARQPSSFAAARPPQPQAARRQGWRLRQRRRYASCCRQASAAWNHACSTHDSTMHINYTNYQHDGSWLFLCHVQTCFYDDRICVHSF
jgi:hypothetical protein